MKFNLTDKSNRFMEVLVLAMIMRDKGGTTDWTELYQLNNGLDLKITANGNELPVEKAFERLEEAFKSQVEERANKLVKELVDKKLESFQLVEKAARTAMEDILSIKLGEEDVTS